MKKSVKIISALLIAMMLLMVVTPCFATMVGNVEFDLENANAADTGEIAKKASSFVKTLRNVAAIAAVIIISILGIKYMLGSVEEKAEYKKSFMPLIIGIVVVMLALQIGAMIFNAFD